MIAIEPHPGRRLRRIGRRLVILALPAAVAVGCGGDDDGPANTPVPTATAPQAATATRTATATSATTSTPTVALTATPTSPPPSATATPPPTQTATTAPNPDALAACSRLAGCNQCFTNSTGTCIEPEACAQRLSADAAICINGAADCDATALGDCLFLGCQGIDATGECP
jgi:hypothetical protein